MLKFNWFECLLNKREFNLIQQLLNEEIYDSTMYKAIKICLEQLRKSKMKQLLTLLIFDDTSSGSYIMLENGEKAYVSQLKMEDALDSPNEELVAKAQMQFKNDCIAIRIYMSQLFSRV